jgi:hypothetical protein
MDSTVGTEVDLPSEMEEVLEEIKAEEEVAAIIDATFFFLIIFFFGFGTGCGSEPSGLGGIVNKRSSNRD